jgi:hypothetical protein
MYLIDIAAGVLVVFVIGINNDQSYITIAKDTKFHGLFGEHFTLKQ